MTTSTSRTRLIARMARIPAKQASASDRDRLRTLEESLGRVVFGQEAAVKTVANAIKRSRAGLGQPEQVLLVGAAAVVQDELMMVANRLGRVAARLRPPQPPPR